MEFYSIRTQGRLLLIGCRRIECKTPRLAAMSTDPGREPLKRFGKRVRLRRTELGYSQEALANRAGFHRTYIGCIERGERNPSLVNILRLAKALDSDPAEFVRELA